MDLSIFKTKDFLTKLGNSRDSYSLIPLYLNANVADKSEEYIEKLQQDTVLVRAAIEKKRSMVNAGAITFIVLFFAWILLGSSISTHTAILIAVTGLTLLGVLGLFLKSSFLDSDFRKHKQLYWLTSRYHHVIIDDRIPNYYEVLKACDTWEKVDEYRVSCLENRSYLTVGDVLVIEAMAAYLAREYQVKSIGDIYTIIDIDNSIDVAEIDAGSRQIEVFKKIKGSRAFYDIKVNGETKHPDCDSDAAIRAMAHYAQGLVKS